MVAIRRSRRLNKRTETIRERADSTRSLAIGCLLVRFPITEHTKANTAHCNGCSVAQSDNDNARDSSGMSDDGSRTGDGMNNNCGAENRKSGRDVRSRRRNGGSALRHLARTK
jgi:hypothetical protein